MSSGTVNRSIGPSPRELLLDQALPRFEARTASTVVVDADVAATYRAVRALDPDQVGQTIPFMRAMAAIRALPARLWPGTRDAREASPGSLSAEQYREAFQLLDEEPGTEFVLGMIGKFMTPRQLEFHRFDPPEFAAFDEPGYGKVAVGFLVLPYGTSRSLLTTETRTATTDPVSARRFRRYWRVVGPFAGYIMRHWVTLAKKHAEAEASG